MNWWVLKRQVHVSWLIATTALCVVIGVWLASHVSQGWFSSITWLFIGLILVTVTLARRYVALTILCIIGGLLIGLWRGSTSQVGIRAYQQLVGRSVTLSGIVKDDVAERDDGRLAIRLKHVDYQGHKLSGTVWVTATQAGDVQRGDKIAVSGLLADGFGNFPASLPRAQIDKVSRPEPGDAALSLRNWFSKKVHKVIPEEPAALGLGYLLGMRRGIPDDLEQALRLVGLTHVIVASGFHLSVVVRFARRLFARVSRFSALAGSSAMMISFIAITGLSPSMARAGLVTGLSLLAWYYGRKFHPLVIIPLAAAVTVLVTPSYAWNDIGWLLSFAAFAGVMVLAPLLQRYFYGDKKPGNVRQILGESISAQLATLPILIVAFGYVSNLAIVSNLLVMPFVSVAMLLVLVAGLGSWLIPWAGQLIALPATWLLEYMIAVVNYIAGLSWVKTDVEVGLGFVVIYYLALVVTCIYMQRVTRVKLREINIVE